VLSFSDALHQVMEQKVLVIAQNQCLGSQSSRKTCSRKRPIVKHDVAQGVVIK
jgi:hypothetical protein